MLFKGNSYLELWQPFCSGECNYLCNFDRGYYEEEFCEIILNFGQWFRRCCLKDFLSGALAESRTIYAILKEGIIGNIHVKLYEIGTIGSGDVFFRHFLSRALAAPLFSGLEPFAQFLKKTS